MKTLGKVASCLCLAGGLLAASLTAQPQAPGENARRAQLKPVYLALQSDPQFLAFQRDVAARPQDAALLESFLRFLPLSPLDYLEIDMETRHYEMAVPRAIQDLHGVWIRLHEQTARSLYGDAHVDRFLNDWPAEVTPEAAAVAAPSIRRLIEAATTGTNRNVAATDSPAPLDYQGEIQVAVNPNNANQLVAAANTWDSLPGCGETQAIFNSSDGGAVWNYTCAPGASAYPGIGSCSGTVFGSDPAVYWDNNNVVYMNYMLLCSLIFTTRYSMVVARSTNGGNTWTGQGIIVTSWGDSDLEDKNFYAVDNSPSSPFSGRHYTCWDRNNNEKFAYSTNSGASWTEVDLPSSSVGGTDLACEIAVEDSGTVHVVFDSLTCGVSTCSDEAMMYTRSTNGGVSWSTPVLVKDFNLAGFSNTNCPGPQNSRCINPFGAIAVDNSGGACDGTLYTVFSDFPSGGNSNDTDVWLSRSTNGGTSWSAPLRINDGGFTGKTQFHPFVQVDQSNGHVVAAWHDARNSAGNTGVDFFVARSTDCGLSFETNIQASQASSEFNNNTISSSTMNTTANPNYNPNQYGEYMGLDVLSGKAYLAWSDTRHYFPGSTTNTQKDNLGFVVVDFAGVNLCGNGVKDSGEACDGSDLGGQTCIGLGFSGGTLSCTASCSFNTSACTGAPPTTTTFDSVAADDGYVLENTETSNTGGTGNATDSTTSALRAGDAKKDKQYKSILSFDTAAIPDTATIQTVKVRLRRGTVVGTNPFTTHGSLNVDVRNGGFNGNVALELADFQAAATATAVCTLPNAAANGDFTECTFNAAGIAAINKTGKTQVRIAFTLDDNDNNRDDYVGFYSGNDATAANHPQLVVTYQ